MSELNDNPESAAERGAPGLDAAEPYDARWPDDAFATGDPTVDSALERLTGIAAVPVAEHSGVYAEIHDSLLAALDADDR